MTVFSRAGWGGIRASLAVASSDLLAVHVAGNEERVPTLLAGSFMNAAPTAAQVASHARVVLYTGTVPTSQLSPVDAASLESLPFVRRCWADFVLAFGQPLVQTIDAEPVAESGLDWWLVLGLPIDNVGAAFAAVASLTLWGHELSRTPSFR